MIKRISLLVTAALLVATMAMAGLAGPAFAVNTCKDQDDFAPSGPSFGQQSDQCDKGSTEAILTGHGKSTTGNNTQTTCVKHTGHGDVPVDCPS